MGYEEDRGSTNISHPLLCVNIRNYQNEIDGYTLQFNLEFFESNYMSSVIKSAENVTATEPAVSNTEKDIFSEVVSQITKESSSDVESDNKNIRNILSDCNYLPSKTFKNGKKRGRKLGYRSENTKDEIAHCGVCGCQVIFQFLAKVIQHK